MKSSRNCAVLVLCGVAALGISLAAQTNGNGGPTVAVQASIKEGPQIKFDAADYNFGKAASGDMVQHTYNVTNIGTAVLVISNVKPSCGCTTAGQWTREVAPGQSGTIPVQFNSTRYSGNVVKSIQVDSNARNLPHATLHLSGSIWKPIDIQPAGANFTVPAGSTNALSTTLHIVNGTDTPLALSNVESSNKKFTGELTETKPGKEFDLVVTAHPPFEPGNTFATVTVKTSRHGMPSLMISATAFCRESVQIYPANLVLVPAADHWTTNRVRLNNDDFAGFQLLQGECSDPRIVVSFQRLHPQHAIYSVLVAAPPGYVQPGNRPLQIKLSTNHPQHHEVDLPVSVIPLNPTVTHLDNSPTIVARTTNAPQADRFFPGSASAERASSHP